MPSPAGLRAFAQRTAVPRGIHQQWLTLFMIAGLFLPRIADAQSPGRGLGVDADASIRIVNLIGSTRVIGWDRDSVHVTGTPPEGGGSLLMGGGRRGVKVVVDGGARPVVAGTALEVHVPSTARLWVKGATASIAVEGVRGEVEAGTVSGSISVSGSPTLLTAESMEGDIDIAAPAQVTRVRTAGGAITMRGATHDVSAVSVSGQVRFLDASGIMNGRVESISGPVTFNGSLAPGGRLELLTHDAPIEIFIPPRPGATVEVSAHGGTVANRIPGATSALVRGKSVHYVIGDGRARVTARSLKGDVTLRQRMPRPNASP